METTINGKHVSFILDTGGAVTLLNKNVRQCVKPPFLELSPWTGRNLICMDGIKIKLLGSVGVVLQLRQIVFSTDVMVEDTCSPKADGILGLDFLKSNSFNFYKGC